MAEEDQTSGNRIENDGAGGDAEINQCPACGGDIDIAGLGPFSKVECPHCEEAVRVRTCLGNFQILKLLGEGGMSQVFLAEDLALDRQVALKILHQELSRDRALMALFEREAKLTASISHPNVVKVYTVGSDAGYFYIAMELVDNVSLDERIVEQGMLPEREALDLLHDVASGLAAANQGGLIHRDIKPGNILLTREGTGKLVDFGLAVQQGGEDEVEDLWATPFYVPPEKLDGKTDDFRGDIYSLGATFFHALAGRPPFEANTASLDELREIKARPVSLVHAGAAVSADTLRLIDRMMAYKPEARHKSYEQLLGAIEEVQRKLPGGAGSRARRHSALDNGRAGASWPVRIGIGGGALAVVGLVVAMIVGNGFDGGESGEALVGDGDRVLSSGEKAVAVRYQEARSLLLAGRAGAAMRAFDSLLEAENAIRQPTLGWTQYNAGLAALMNGESDAKTREIFARMAEAPGFEAEAEASLAAQASFFRAAGKWLSDPLPVLASDAPATDGLEAFALLACGMKNWNHGEFDSALAFFDTFAAASFPAEYPWMESYRALVEPFRADLVRIRRLPKPSITMSETELAEAAEKLTTELAAFKTRGGARALAQRRLDRVAPLIEAKKALAAAPPEPEKTPAVTTPSPEVPPASMTTTPAATETNPWTPEAEAEKARFAEGLAPTGALLADYRFAEARELVAGLPVETDPVRGLKEDLLAAVDGAEAFRDRLVTALADGQYEGKLERKEGLALDCKIVAADADKLVVDLMFGPNDLPWAAVSPAWMLKSGEDFWLTTPPEAGVAAEWEAAAWFARLCGQRVRASEIAATVAPLSETFAERWERLDALP